MSHQMAPEPTSHGARFRLRCWGARGTVPSPGPNTTRYGGHTACVEVRTADNALLVLDAGTGIRGLGRQIEPGSSVHLLLSHRHSDHVIGLPHFAPLFTPDSTVRVTCGNADVTTTRALLHTLLSPPLFPPVASIDERLHIEAFCPGAPLPVGTHTTVHRVDAQHPGGAAIFRIDDERGPAVAFAPDNELAYTSNDPAVLAWRESLIAALRGVPVLIHDAMYTDNELAAHAGWGHSSAIEATRLGMECLAGLLVLFHHHPDRTDAEMDAIVQECRQYVALSGSSLRVIAAWEGLTLTV
jgi:phosphoribosyl 1,2-cyclic phosphodiesterase